MTFSLCACKRACMRLCLCVVLELNKSAARGYEIDTGGRSKTNCLGVDIEQTFLFPTASPPAEMTPKKRA